MFQNRPPINCVRKTFVHASSSDALRERLLTEQLDYNLLLRRFVGLSTDDRVWDTTVFSKNRECLLEGDIAKGLFERFAQNGCFSASW
jgi:transposase